MNQQVIQHGARHNAQKSARTTVFLRFLCGPGRKMPEFQPAQRFLHGPGRKMPRFLPAQRLFRGLGRKMPEILPALLFSRSPGRKMPEFQPAHLDFSARTERRGGKSGGRAEKRRSREAEWRSGGGAEWQSGGVAEWREGEKEWREGEKCERFRIYYREVPRRGFCGGVL